MRQLLRRIKYKWERMIEVYFKHGNNPLEYTLSEVGLVLRKIFAPYNVVKLPNLRRGWCDRDGIMLHAMMQIVVDFVDLEWGGPKKHLVELKEWLKEDQVWSFEKQFAIQHVEYDLKVIKLYIQWKQILAKGLLYEIPEEEEDQMLRDVLEIRRGLWT